MTKRKFDIANIANTSKKQKNAAIPNMTLWIHREILALRTTQL